MRTDELDYNLPESLIATTPAEPRDSARLMVVHRDSGRIEHRHVRDLPGLGVLKTGDLMVTNQTRVVQALFEATRTQTGGRVGGLYLEEVPGEVNEVSGVKRWRVMLESRGTLRVGEGLTLCDGTVMQLVEKHNAGRWEALVHSTLPSFELLDRVGRTPLPPYLRQQRRLRHTAEVQPSDTQRYNTVYAHEPGSVAAPTAGLHFTPGLLASLESCGVHRASVTLHVGTGTFAPVRTDTLEDHTMHFERYRVPPEVCAGIKRVRREKGRILCVGTTTVRTLESLPPEGSWDGHAIEGRTDLFIHPEAVAKGFRFRFTDMLLTNFHLPRSTLLAMVGSLPGVGLDNLKAWYQTAITERYRFYSYGDAMLIV
ncbi:MAG: tRNA preQ1(34) S-adenosylmethionine ribosyltransferase-isomerase QueA [Phycisphaera sp.]|nr:tRNA preQ1(34) S-adenosylmethionine ribosyltransferase-isomerase QueA [Phycisphaera sp.]